MMLDVDFADLKQGFLHYLPIGATVGAVVLGRARLRRRLAGAPGARDAPARRADRRGRLQHGGAGAGALHAIFLFFQAAGLVLLTAMIGAIVLTLHHKPGVKRQKIAEQNARTRDNVIDIKKVPSRAGL